MAQICADEAEAGGKIEAVFPHRISGRNKHGKPNRQGCPGSRVYSHAEGWALVHGLRAAAADERYGGTVVPEEWRSQAWKDWNRGP